MSLSSWQFARVYTARVNSSNVDVAATTLEDIRQAATRIGSYVHRTPLLSSASLSEAIGVEVRLKCENLQRAGSFKVRGAMNALLQIAPDARKNGVVAFSSGNHAQGVALAARLLGMTATIVMPRQPVADEQPRSRVEQLSSPLVGAQIGAGDSAQEGRWSGLLSAARQVSALHDRSSSSRW